MREGIDIAPFSALFSHRWLDGHIDAHDSLTFYASHSSTKRGPSPAWSKKKTTTTRKKGPKIHTFVNSSELHPDKHARETHTNCTHFSSAALLARAMSHSQIYTRKYRKDSWSEYAKNRKKRDNFLCAFRQSTLLWVLKVFRIFHLPIATTLPPPSSPSSRTPTIEWVQMCFSFVSPSSLSQCLWKFSPIFLSYFFINSFSDFSPPFGKG